jgi:hypothetical protein
MAGSIPMPQTETKQRHDHTPECYLSGRLSWSQDFSCTSDSQVALIDTDVEVQSGETISHQSDMETWNYGAISSAGFELFE